MKKLPKYFIIKKDKKNPLWNDYLSWLNETYRKPAGEELYVGSEEFYGYDNNILFESGTYCSNSLSFFCNKPTLITLEYWNECVNEFQLPEKWCIKSDKNPVIGEWFNENKQNSFYGDYKKEPGYFHYPCWGAKNHIAETIKNGYTEITFEQFKKYVLKQGSMEKKLIGYKLKESCLKYEEAVVKLSDMPNYPTIRGYYRVVGNKISISNFKVAGVLDLWFEPVYEESFKIGDWIYIISTDSSISRTLLDTKKLHYGAEEGDIVQIKGITFKDGLATEDDPRYYGDNFNLRAEGFRLAKPEEILEFKVKEFTKKTGIEVGSTIIAPSDILGKVTWDDSRKCWRTSEAIGNRRVLGFRLHDDGTLLMSISGTATTTFCDAYKMRLANSVPDITIKGYKAGFTKDSVSFGCQIYPKEFVLKLSECLEKNDFDMEIRSEIDAIAKYFISLD